MIGPGFLALDWKREFQLQVRRKLRLCLVLAILALACLDWHRAPLVFGCPLNGPFAVTSVSSCLDNIHGKVSI